MVDYHTQPNSLVTLRFFLVVLCISMIIIQVGQALSDDFLSLSSSPTSSAEDDHDHQLNRRNPLVAKMLKQILQRGEMQVEPHRIQAALGKLHRRKTLVPVQHHWGEYS